MVCPIQKMSVLLFASGNLSVLYDNVEACVIWTVYISRMD